MYTRGNVGTVYHERTGTHAGVGIEFNVVGNNSRNVVVQTDEGSITLESKQGMGGGAGPYTYMALVRSGDDFLLYEKETRYGTSPAFRLADWDSLGGSLAGGQSQAFMNQAAGNGTDKMAESNLDETRLTVLGASETFQLMTGDYITIGDPPPAGKTIAWWHFDAATLPQPDSAGRGPWNLSGSGTYQGADYALIIPPDYPGNPGGVNTTLGYSLTAGNTPLSMIGSSPFALELTVMTRSNAGTLYHERTGTHSGVGIEVNVVGDGSRNVVVQTDEGTITLSSSETMQGAGPWTYMAVVRDGDTFSLYEENTRYSTPAFRLASSASCPGSLAGGQTQVFMMQAAAGVDKIAETNLDEERLTKLSYNSTFQLMNGENVSIGGPAPNVKTIAWWHFDSAIFYQPDSTSYGNWPFAGGGWQGADYAMIVPPDYPGNPGGVDTVASYYTVAGNTPLSMIGDKNFALELTVQTRHNSGTLYHDRTGTHSGVGIEVNIYQESSRNVIVQTDQGSITLSSSANVGPVNAWTYLALVRVGDTFYLYEEELRFGNVPFHLADSGILAGSVSGGQTQAFMMQAAAGVDKIAETNLDEERLTRLELGVGESFQLMNGEFIVPIPAPAEGTVVVVR